MIHLSACYALVIILVFGMAACDGRAAVGDGPETAGATRDGVHTRNLVHLFTISIHYSVLGASRNRGYGVVYYMDRPALLKKGLY